MNSHPETKLKGINIWFVIEILSFYGYILSAIVFIFFHGLKSSFTKEKNPSHADMYKYDFLAYHKKDLDWLAFVSILFSALNINYVLQELILTDDALAFCGINNFAKLYETLRNNKASALCFIDFSRNVHSIDDNVEINEGMVDALSN